MMRVSKYHGCGNSFVIVREEELPVAILSRDEEDRIAAYGKLALNLCDKDTGLGADGFLVVREKPELEMIFFNQDGSRAPMCGNGIRCFAHYCMDKDICIEGEYPVKTLGGTMIVEVLQDEPFRARINMGKPDFTPASFDVITEDPDFLDKEIQLAGGVPITVSGLFMGTHHVVVFVNKIDRKTLEPIGAEICNHPVFTKKTNVNFVEVIDEETLRVLTYERGVGITLACGTGACASVVIANRKGLTKKKANVLLKLGTLGIEIQEDGNVYMEGPSARIIDGTLG